MTDPMFAIETVTPEVAREWLDEHNRGNRSLKPWVVNRYAADMAEGNWDLTGVPIIFDRSGRLMDGQHRLMACVKSGVPLVTAVARGAAEHAMANIDTGATRTMGDLLKWQGEKSYNALAAGIRMEWKWAQGAEALVAASRKPTNAQALEWLDLNPGLRDAVTLAGRLHKPPVSLPSGVAVAFTHQVAMLDPQEAGAFIEEVVTGHNLQPGSGSLLLRNWAMSQNARSGHTRPTGLVWLAMTVKAWNLWILGSDARLLAWKRGGSNREQFPALLDLNGDAVVIKAEKAAAE